MGMFDYIKFKDLDGFENEDFQTKSLVNLCDYFEVRGNELWREEYDTEDRSDPSATGVDRLFGMLTKTNERWVKQNYTGEIRFYTNLEQDPNGKRMDWVEFLAIFKDGKMLGVERDTEAEDKFNHFSPNYL